MKLSIITINYNNRDGLRKTIESVVAQTTRDFEYIIIDGGSTDGSVDVIKEYADYIDYWVSESDKGIYNAMNKGVAVAHGDFCLFLNSGDWLFSNYTLKALLPQICLDTDIITGNIYFKLTNGSIKKFNGEIPNSLSIPFFLNNTLPHQSTLIKTLLLKKRKYKETYRIISDWVFLFDSYLYEDSIKYKKINANIAFYDCTGISSTETNLLFQERDRYLSTLNILDIVGAYSHIPYTICAIFQSLPHSYRFIKVLKTVNKLLFDLYIHARRYYKKNI